MDLARIRADVVAIIAEVAEIPEESITEDAPLEDLGVDSLMGLEIVAKAEKKYKIEIPEEEIPKLKTLRHIFRLTLKSGSLSWVHSLSAQLRDNVSLRIHRQLKCSL